MSQTQQLESRQLEILKQLKQLESRLDNITASTEITPTQEKIEKVCNEIGLQHQLIRVPSTYYTWELSQRASYLNASSPEYLCKSLIFENTECTNSDTSNQTNSRYYCIIIQYTSKIQSHKIFKYIKGINPQETSKKFNFRLCPSDVSQKLTGFEYNAVCPLGTTERIPIIINQQIIDLPRGTPVFLGGGEVDLKLAVDIHSFKEKMESIGTTVFVTDVIDTPTTTNNSNTTKTINNNNFDEI